MISLMVLLLVLLLELAVLLLSVLELAVLVSRLAMGNAYQKSTAIPMVQYCPLRSIFELEKLCCAVQEYSK